MNASTALAASVIDFATILDPIHVDFSSMSYRIDTEFGVETCVFAIKSAFKLFDFSVLFFGCQVGGLFLDRVWIPVGLDLGSIFNDFLCFLHDFLEHEICFDSSSSPVYCNFSVIIDGFLMNSLLAYPPCKTFKNDYPCNESICFYTSEKH